MRQGPRQCRYPLPIPPKGIWLRSMRPGFQGPVTSPLSVYPLCSILSTSIFPTFCRRRCSSTTDTRHGRRAIWGNRHCIPPATNPTESWGRNTGGLYEHKKESKRLPIITDEKIYCCAEDRPVPVEGMADTLVDMFIGKYKAGEAMDGSGFRSFDKSGCLGSMSFINMQ